MPEAKVVLTPRLRRTWLLALPKALHRFVGVDVYAGSRRIARTTVGRLSR